MEPQYSGVGTRRAKNADVLICRGNAAASRKAAGRAKRSDEKLVSRVRDLLVSYFRLNFPF